MNVQKIWKQRNDLILFRTEQLECLQSQTLHDLKRTELKCRNCNTRTIIQHNLHHIRFYSLSVDAIASVIWTGTNSIEIFTQAIKRKCQSRLMQHILFDHNHASKNLSSRSMSLFGSQFSRSSNSLENLYATFCGGIKSMLN